MLASTAAAQPLPKNVYVKAYKADGTLLYLFDNRTGEFVSLETAPAGSFYGYVYDWKGSGWWELYDNSGGELVKVDNPLRVEQGDYFLLEANVTNFGDALMARASFATWTYGPLIYDWSACPKCSDFNLLPGDSIYLSGMKFIVQKCAQPWLYGLGLYWGGGVFINVSNTPGKWLGVGVGGGLFEITDNLDGTINVAAFWTVSVYGAYAESRGGACLLYGLILCGFGFCGWAQGGTVFAPYGENATVNGTYKKNSCIILLRRGLCGKLVVQRLPGCVERAVQVPLRFRRLVLPVNRRQLVQQALPRAIRFVATNPSDLRELNFQEMRRARAIQFVATNPSNLRMGRERLSCELPDRHVRL